MKTQTIISSTLGKHSQLFGVIGSVTYDGDINYDLTKADYRHACTRCGCGGRFASKVFISKARVPKSPVFESYDGDWICTGSMANELIQDHGVKKSELISVHSESGTSLDLYVLQPKSLAGPMEYKYSKMSYDKSCACSECKRRGYYNKRNHVYVYQREHIANCLGQACCRTWECIAKVEKRPIDTARDHDFPRPYLLVQSSIAELFRTATRGKVHLQDVWVTGKK